MATIRKRFRNDGSVGYQAEIRIKRRGEIIHRESLTFDKEKNARLWSRRREAELDNPEKLRLAMTPSHSIRTLIDRYMKEFGQLTRMGRSKTEGESIQGQVFDL